MRIGALATAACRSRPRPDYSRNRSLGTAAPDDHEADERKNFAPPGRTGGISGLGRAEFDAKRMLLVSDWTCYSRTMRNIVNAVFLRNGRVLLARRNAHRAAHAGLWSFPGGRQEQNETLASALVREVQEEVGVRPTAFRLLGTIGDPNTMDTDTPTFHVYAVTARDGGEPGLLGDEHVDLQWFTLEGAINLPDLALAEYRPILSTMLRAR